MRIVYLTAGSGRRECDACLRDSSLARALIRMGHDVLLVPLYTPLIDPEAQRMAVDKIFFGGINVYLQQKFPLFRHTPRLLDRLFDAKWLLRYVARFGHMTEAEELVDMTVSVLEGNHGHQRKELDRLVEWLAAHAHPDVVILANTLFAGMAKPIRKKLNAPVIALVSGEDTFIEDFPPLHRNRALAVLQKSVRGADALISGTQWYSRFMTNYLQIPPESIRVAEPGVPHDLFHPHRRPPAGVPFTIGFRTAISPATGLDKLAEAFILLKKRPATADARLRVAGYLGPNDRPYLDNVRNRLAAAGHAQHFEYVGELDPPARAEYLASIHTLAVPTEYPEPIGMFVLEAAAAAVPVVMPSKGCLPEWIENTRAGILTQSNDPAEIADALARIATEPDLARRFATSGRAAIQERFTIEHMAQRMIDTLQNILAGK